MEIRLVTSSMNDDVHGTENDKKTGCGINLTKPENVTRYHRGAAMTDLKEITCEKCKAALAKKIIKADKKEMDRIIKEERMRQKKGIEDENIVPLGNTVAKITRAPEEKSAEKPVEKPAVKPAEAPAPAPAPVAEPEPAPAPAPVVPPSPGSFAMNDDLAQFAINVPQSQPEPEPEPAPAPAPSPSGVQDDFLAQFAINVPKEETPAAPAVQDDFLAQFAIPTPTETAPDPDVYGEPAPAPEPVQPAAPVLTDNIEDIVVPDMSGYNSGFNQQHAAPEPAPAPEPEPVKDVVNDIDDIMKMFTISNGPAAPAPAPQPAYNEEEVIDITDQTTPVVSEPEPQAEDEAQPEAASEWDLVADQIFGLNGAPAPEAAQPAEAPAAPPVIEDIAPAAPPVIEDITPPVIEDIIPQAAPAAPAPEITAPPVIEEIAPPVIEDIIPAAPEQAAPVIEEIAPPVIEDIAPPVIENIAPQPAVQPAPAPVLSDNIEDIVVPDMSSYNSGFNHPAPQQPAPVPTPEYSKGDENDMNKYRYSTPVFADEIKNHAQPAAPVQPAAEQPQIITVPQFAGYDVNGQPIYTYVQMQMTGRDANGQPIFAPIPGQTMAQPAPIPQVAPVQQAAPAPQAAPAQQAAPAPQVAPVQQAAPAPQAAPVQQAAPVRPAAPVQNPSGYTAPTANVSKIAVNPHPKATSQAFINAISNAKSYADKSLLDTQGLQKNAPLFDSIEDVLSGMGDTSIKRKQAVAQKDVQVAEYKAPSRSSSYSSSQTKKTESAQQDERFMSKAELKAKKKQDKIDAKFKKDLAKRGF